MKLLNTVLISYILGWYSCGSSSDYYDRLTLGVVFANVVENPMEDVRMVTYGPEDFPVSGDVQSFIRLLLIYLLNKLLRFVRLSFVTA